MNKAEVYIEIESDNVKELYKALKVEERDAITHAEVSISEKKLIITIKADEISDIRAAINSWLRLVKMCEEVCKILNTTN